MPHADESQQWSLCVHEVNILKADTGAGAANPATQLRVPLDGGCRAWGIVLCIFSVFGANYNQNLGDFYSIDK